MTRPAGEFGGEERFAAAPGRLFDVLTDLETLAANIPNLVSAERPDDRTLKCVIKPGFSFLRGTLKVTISLADLQPPSAAAMSIAAQGIGSAMQIGSRLQIAAEGTGSLLKWQAKIERASGLLASIPGGLLQAAADQTIRHAWQQIREKLGEPPHG